MDRDTLLKLLGQVQTRLETNVMPSLARQLGYTTNAQGHITGNDLSPEALGRVPMFAGEMQAVNPGGFAGAMTSSPLSAGSSQYPEVLDKSTASTPPRVAPNQASVGQPGPAYKTSIDTMTSRLMGGPALQPSQGMGQVQAFNPTAGGGSNEQMIEQAGGWTPGMRQQFDMAMLTKDPVQVRHLLPFVPQEYMVKFSQEIGNILHPR